MGNSKWLVVAGLALVAAFAPGCKTECEEVPATNPADGGTRTIVRPTMSPFPGVVEIYRYTEGKVGYVCVDADPNVSWWLLSGSETPPVMPWTTVWTDDVTWHKVSGDSVTGEQLCSQYGRFLTEPRLWRVTREAPTHCSVWKVLK